MADRHTLTKRQNEIAVKILHFDVSTGFKAGARPRIHSHG